MADRKEELTKLAESLVDGFKTSGLSSGEWVRNNTKDAGLSSAERGFVLITMVRKAMYWSPS